MRKKLLQLNDDKMKIVVFSPSAAGNAIAEQLGPLSSSIQPDVKNLVVIFYYPLKFDKQISAIVSGTVFSSELLLNSSLFFGFGESQSCIRT